MKPVNTDRRKSLNDRQPRPSGKVQANAHFGAAVGAYAGTHNLHTYVTGDPWKTDRKRWRDSATGRGTVRVLARGVVGAALFALGEIYASRTMHGQYGTKNWYNFFHPEYKIGWKSPITHKIAYAYDWLLTKPMVMLFGGSRKAGLFQRIGLLKKEGLGEYLTTFRHTRRFEDVTQLYQSGRSFGAEAVGVSFGFGMMSFGDSTVRYTARLLDPKEKKPWHKHRHGNIFQKAWDVAMFYGDAWVRNVGEDVFATIFYVPFMRLTRRTIDNIHPGYASDQDYATHGGPFVVGKRGGALKFVGDSQAWGMLDIFSRFTVYNVFTKWWQDLVSWTQDRHLHWKESGYKKPHLEKPKDGWAHAAVRKTMEMAEYLTRSTIKSIAYMIPAAGLFALIRSPQSKSIGFLMDRKGNQATFKNGDLVVATQKSPKSGKLRDDRYFRDARGGEPQK